MPRDLRKEIYPNKDQKTKKLARFLAQESSKTTTRLGKLSYSVVGFDVLISRASGVQVSLLTPLTSSLNNALLTNFIKIKMI